MNQAKPRTIVSLFPEEEEESVYFREAREHFVEDDILNTKDDGFMQGYEEGFAEIEDTDDWVVE